jgi:hypothetical protein
MFCHLLGTACLNAFIIYQKKDRKMTRLDFNIFLAVSWTTQCGTPKNYAG